MVPARVTAIFIFELDHEDRPAVFAQVGADDFGQFVEIAGHRFGEAWIGAAQFDIRRAQQPPWQSAQIPFAAAIGAGPQDDPHAFLFGQFEELPEVALVGGEVELALLALVVVPEHIDRNGVEPHGFCHLDAVAPVLVRDPRRMNLATDDLKWFAVQQEFGVIGSAEGKRVRRGLLRGRNVGAQGKRCHGKDLEDS